MFYILNFCKIYNESAKGFDLFFLKTKCVFKLQLNLTIADIMETKNMFPIRRSPLGRDGTLQGHEVQEKVASP